MEQSNDKRMSIETSATGDEVFLHANPAGLRQLAKVLERLAAQAETGGFPHDHFFTEAWGAGDLTRTVHDPQNRLVHHLKVFGWPKSAGGATHGT